MRNVAAILLGITLLFVGCSQKIESRALIYVSPIVGSANTAFLEGEMDAVQTLAAPLINAGEQVWVSVKEGADVLEIKVQGGDPQKCDATLQKIVNAYTAVPRSDAEVQVLEMPTVSIKSKR